MTATARATPLTAAEAAAASSQAATRIEAWFHWQAHLTLFEFMTPHKISPSGKDRLGRELERIVRVAEGTDLGRRAEAETKAITEDNHAH